MRISFLMVLCAALMMSGCAVLNTPSRVDTLENRLDSVERRQVSLEDDLQSQGTNVSYESTETSEAAVSGGPVVEMTKKEIQSALKNAGYYFGTIDGTFGKQTRKAIKDFQQDKGLKVDGLVGTETTRALSPYLSK